MSKLMTETELLAWIPRRLGAPNLRVPLDDAQLADAISEAKRWFAAKKGIDRDFTLLLNSGQREYPMPDDCDAVTNVAFEANPLDISMIFSPSIIADERVPYNVFAAPSSAGLYGSFVQSLQYVQLAKHIISADVDWIYYPYKKILLVTSAAKSIGHAIVEYKSNTVPTIEQLPERDHDLIKRFALAWAKRDLGNMYSRYSSWPGAEGPVQLNGPQLIEQAEAEFKQLEVEIFGTGGPIPVLLG